MKSIHILLVTLVVWGSLFGSKDTINQSTDTNEADACLIVDDCDMIDSATEEADVCLIVDDRNIIDAATEEVDACLIINDCDTIDAATEEAIEEVFRKIDDDLKEGLVYFSSFLHGIMQMIEGKNQDRQLVLNGIHQSVGSLVEILMIGQKRNKLEAIANEDDLKKLILWFARAMQQPIAKRTLL